MLSLIVILGCCHSLTLTASSDSLIKFISCSVTCFKAASLAGFLPSNGPSHVKLTRCPLTRNFLAPSSFRTRSFCATFHLRVTVLSASCFFAPAFLSLVESFDLTRDSLGTMRQIGGFLLASTRSREDCSWSIDASACARGVGGVSLPVLAST